MHHPCRLHKQRPAGECIGAAAAASGPPF